MPKLNKSLSFILILVIFLTPFVWPEILGNTKADLANCVIWEGPPNVSPNSTGSLGFTIFNDGGFNAITWVKITSPSSNYTITSGSADGWTGNVSGSSIIFTGGTQAVGASTGYAVNVSTGSETAQMQWSAQVSDSVDGSNAINCTGDIRIAISDTPADRTPPNITSDVTVTGVSDTSVSLNWTTDEPATSVINYGTTNAYGSTVSDSTLSSTHSVTISGLSANTTYHFSIASTDAWNNSNSSDDNVFSISQGATTTVVTTTTVVNTKTVTQIIADTLPPGISLSTDFSKVYDKAPVISGSATDNSGVAKVEYSIDDGRNWLGVDLNKIGAKSVSFQFLPAVIDDGNYNIKVRATDSSGNIKDSTTHVLIIDRLPPMIGGTLYSLGALVLNPEADGTIIGIAGLSQKITLSAIGGPTSINLTAGEATFPLTQNPESNLWNGNITFDSPGTYKLSTVSVDGAGNTTQKDLNTINVVPGGVISGEGQTAISGAIVSLYYFDETTGGFVLWQGSSYSEDNPTATNELGQYQFIVPAGKYYLSVKKTGYETTYSEIFTLNKTTPINANLIIKRAKGVQIGPFSLYLPSFSTPQKVLFSSDFGAVSPQDLVGKSLPDFNFESGGKAINNVTFFGKPTLITLLNSWLPQTSEALTNLSDQSLDKRFNTVAVMEQESASSIQLFKARGGYNLPLFADPDGILIKPLNVTTLPVNIFLDRNGVVKDVKLGILSKEEMQDRLSQ